MKNIHEILESFGVAVAEDRKADFEKQLFLSYKSAAEVEKKDSKISLLQQELERLRGTAQEQEQSYARALEERDLTASLDMAILKAKGRNPKAILALLDREALKKSRSREQDICQALEALKKSDGYLFEDREVPPPYARGTGSFAGAQKKMPATLAGALKERFDKERK